MSFKRENISKPSDSARDGCSCTSRKIASTPAAQPARANGSILDDPTGTGGFGYDPVFDFTELHKSFAELTREEKNQHSHRGKAFRRLLALLPQLD